MAKLLMKVTINIDSNWNPRWTILKGSPGLSHFIFEINVGKGRIRHRTTLNSNDATFDRFWVDLEFKFQSRSMSDPLLSDTDSKNKMAWVWTTLKTLCSVCEIMEDITGHVTFIVIPTVSHEKSVENESFNVRTLYDYNPDADEYIPCKELGLFFKKGEILKIHR